MAAAGLTAPSVAHEQAGNAISATESMSYPLLDSRNVAVTPASPAIPPIMHRIAKCESGGKQFDESGAVVRSHTQDVGKYQINLSYWSKEAEKLGHDIMTEEGNEAMALELYRKYDTDPWSSSKRCWGKTQASK